MEDEDPHFDKGHLLALISEMLDGDLSGSERDELNAILKASPEARAFYRSRMELHAALHLEASVQESPGARAPSAVPARRGFRRPIVAALAATVIAHLALAAILLWIERAPATFATLETIRAARWESSDHGITEGSRIGAGTIRLSEGLATLRFDSGLEVTLEGPTELRLVDALHCKLPAGIMEAKVPTSAHGFSVETPWVRIIDRGTRFSVAVDPAGGETRTWVYEGRVEVEHPATGKVVSLVEGQGNRATELDLGNPTEEAEQPSQRPADHRLDEEEGAGWTLLGSSKDAYIGSSEVHTSETLLLVKNGPPERRAFLGFDLAEIDPDQIVGAELRLHFAPTGFGMAAFVPDATFSVHGFSRPNLKWKSGGGSVGSLQSLGGKPRERLGSFVVPQGVQSGEFVVRGEALANFLRQHAGTEVTLTVVRDTAETDDNGLVHGFASRRHPTLPAPTLAIRMKAP